MSETNVKGDKMQGFFFLVHSRDTKSLSCMATTHEGVHVPELPIYTASPYLRPMYKYWHIITYHELCRANLPAGTKGTFSWCEQSGGTTL